MRRHSKVFLAQKRRLNRKIRRLNVEMLESRRVLATLGPLGPITSDWIVQFDSEAPQGTWAIAAARKTLSSKGIDVEVVRGLGREGLFQVRTYAFDDFAAFNAFNGNSHIQTFDLNRVIDGAAIPNDSDFGSQTGLLNVGQFGALADADVDAEEAWEVSTGDSEVVVGIIDSGVDLTHPDLYLNVWINQGEISAAKRLQIVDVDADGVFTFYDLNSTTNASFVNDLNANGYIDADDLLEDPLWADGIDSDQNEFIDDFFGWNFRLDSDEPFSPNNPSDQLGHGTHVAGIVGAMGNNQIGIAGLNWRSSLMSLKFLDVNNRGDLASAIAAVNYATTMRSQFSVNVRVLNNSWGQAGSPNSLLREAIERAGEAGILSVAAAGNGNVLGQGVSNDDVPFYPANYDLPFVIAVGASDGHDRLASFSNFGNSTVDVLAPGVGIRSTLPNGRYGEVNGTSMAAPFVTGTAALLWASQPQATVAEVRGAILDSVDRIPEFTNLIATSGRLNTANALNSTSFTPVATLSQPEDIVTSGTERQEITVVYQDKTGIDPTTLGDNDLVVRHLWGKRESLPVTLKPNSVQLSANGTIASASYFLAPPDGAWDPLDFGTYQVETVTGGVVSRNGRLSTRSEIIGAFQVRIQSPSVLYVTRGDDSMESGTLRSAIAAANARPNDAQLIILDARTHGLAIPPISSDFTFDSFNSQRDCGLANSPINAASVAVGDLDILGDITIVGDSPQTSIIDAQGIDRVFKVHPNATLTLQRVSVTGGLASDGHGGGGILSLGELSLISSEIAGNAAPSSPATSHGGGIAAWAGSVNMTSSRITGNQSDIGGGVFACGEVSLNVNQSTFDQNSGGGIVSYSTLDATIANSTLALNLGVAVSSRARDFEGGTGSSHSPSLSRDGTKVVYLSAANNLAANDTNRQTDAFLYDIAKDHVERLNLSSTGQQANGLSTQLQLAGNGASALFLTAASNLFVGDDLFSNDLIQRDLVAQSTSLVSTTNPSSRDTRGQPSISDDGRIVVYQQAVSDDPNNDWGVYVSESSSSIPKSIDLKRSGTPVDISSLNGTSISGDGRYIAIASLASGKLDQQQHDIYLYDRQSELLTLPLIRTLNSQSDGSNYDPVMDFNGRYMAFVSDDSHLVSEDTNGFADVFVYDAQSGVVSRVSLSSQGIEGNGPSSSPTISSDGRYIAFYSLASNLVANDTNGLGDVFVFDRMAGTTERVSVNSDGSQSNGDSGSPSISGDGRYVAFDSTANNLSSSHPNHVAKLDPQVRQVYVYDRQADSLRSVSAFTLNSTVNLSNSTVAFNTAETSIAGNVSANNSLFAGNRVSSDLGALSASEGHNVFESASDPSKLATSDIVDPINANKLSPFQSRNSLPPGYLLRQGNPAIDAGSSTSSGSIDQWGRLRNQPDIGALEAVSASLKGTVFIDYDANLVKTSDEQGFPNAIVFIDSNRDGIVQGDERVTQTASSNQSTVTLAGEFSLDDLTPTLQTVRVVVPENWQTASSPIARAAVGNLQGNGNSLQVTISRDGQTIAYLSTASNLTAGDTADPSLFIFSTVASSIEKIPVAGTNLSVLDFLGTDEQFILLRNDEGVYVFDRLSKQLEPVSVSNTGALANAHSDDAAASADGRWIVFSSFANNLVSGDTDNFADIFLFDRQLRTVESITKSTNGSQGNNDSENPSISLDGRYIAFTSDANNLVASDTNGRADAFVYDRIQQRIRRVNVSNTGTESNGFTYPPRISGDGRTVVFQSLAGNLTPDSVTGIPSLFAVDLVSGIIDRLDIPFGASSQGINFNPSISEDGQYLAFEAPNDLMDSRANPAQRSIFVFDRLVSPTTSATSEGQIKLLSHSVSGGQGGEASLSNGVSRRPAFSGNGRFIAFDSTASDLVNNDTNQWSDIFLATNPFESNSRLVTLSVGEELGQLTIGLTPDPGSIAGTIFNDLNGDDVYDLGEPVLSGWTVYLDLNGNQRADGGEPQSVSLEDGTYEFAQTIAFREYDVRVQLQTGWQSSTNSPTSNAEQVFLPAGGRVSQVNFGLRRQSTGGQSTNGRIEGTAFQDLNRDGIQQAAEAGIAGLVVYLDLDSDQQRDFDEPRAVTNSVGKYSFESLGARSYVVRALLSEGSQLTAPVGNQFQTKNYAFSTNSTTILSPQDIVVADFDGQKGPDLAVALFSANAIAIPFNDGTGNYSQSPRVIPTPSGQGPIALVSGDLNGQGSIDLAVANALNSTISVLLDWNGNGFERIVTLATMGIASDIAMADIDGDLDRDVLVLTRTPGQAGRVEVFLNNGAGMFTQALAINTQGKTPTSLVVGDFDRNGRPDLAVTHLGESGRANGVGDVRILLASASSGFATPVAYPVGASPTSIDYADLNGDGFQDLVVVNFSANTASILLGNGSGQFIASSDLLSVGAGPVQVSLVDIEGDGDRDVLVSNLRSMTISIIRNRLSQLSSVPGTLAFEAAESFGSAAFSVSPRLVFAAADLDGSGTMDLALVNSESNTVNVMSNALIGGANRLALSGVESIVDQNFGLQTVIISPSLDPITSPSSILEDRVSLTLPLTGIQRGLSSGPPLRLSARSSDPAIVSINRLDHTEGSSTGSIVVIPEENQNGLVSIIVTAQNAGADSQFDTADDGVIERTVSFVVQSVNDAPSIRIGGNRTVTRGTGLRLIPGFATGFQAGGGVDEQPQSIAEYIVSNDRTDLFLIQPSIDNEGNLRFQPGLTLTGRATVRVQVRDSGGTDFGGVDRSVIQTFQIDVTDVADEAMDFGDAPLATQSGFIGSYPTRLIDDGARHRLSPLVLGSVVDSEADGQPTADALGDSAGNQDEEGITFVAQLTADPNLPTVASVVALASADGLLDAWIDFNQDGDWNDTGEQILASSTLVTGRNLVSFTVPSGAKSGTTHARFRLSTLGNLRPTGEAADGEVEDYAVQIVSGQSERTLTLLASVLKDHEVSISNALLFIRSEGRTVYSASIVNIVRVECFDNAGNSLYTLDSSFAELGGLIQYDSTAAAVSFVSAALVVDLTGPLGSLLKGIDQVTLNGPLPQTLKLDRERIIAISRTGDLKIALGQNDQILSGGNWNLKERFQSQGTILQVFESLQTRLTIQSAAAFQNPFNGLDVIPDDQVLPIDVLIVINYLNLGAPIGLPPFDAATALAPTYLDVDGNNKIEPLDALLVINFFASATGDS